MKDYVFVLILYLFNRAYHGPFWIFARIFSPIYYFYIFLLCGCEVSYKMKLGKNLKIYHALGIVINPNSILGDNVVLRHGVTIGNTGRLQDEFEHPETKGCPIIEDDVEFGAYSAVIGPIRVPKGTTIPILSLYKPPRHQHIEPIS